MAWKKALEPEVNRDRPHAVFRFELKPSAVFESLIGELLCIEAIRSAVIRKAFPQTKYKSVHSHSLFMSV